MQIQAEACTFYIVSFVLFKIGCAEGEAQTLKN